MPSTRSPHHGTSTEWFSSTRTFSVAAAQCTLAMQESGVPAKCIAMGTPYSCAPSPIFLVSRIPPEVARSTETRAALVCPTVPPYQLADGRHELCDAFVQV